MCFSSFDGQTSYNWHINKRVSYLSLTYVTFLGFFVRSYERLILSPYFDLMIYVLTCDPWFCGNSCCNFRRRCCGFTRSCWWRNLKYMNIHQLHVVQQQFVWMYRKVSYNMSTLFSQQTGICRQGSCCIFLFFSFKLI